MRLFSVLATPALLSALALPTTSSAAARPDLKVSGLKPTPSQVAAGGTLTATWTLKNGGAGRAIPSTGVVVLSSDKKIDKKDLLLVKPKTKALAGRRSATATVKLSIPKTVKPGQYRLIACADHGRKVRELSERNNCAAAKVTIGSLVLTNGQQAPAGEPPSRPAAGNENLPPGPTPPGEQPGDAPGDKPGDRPGENPPPGPGPIPDPSKVAPKLNEDAATSVYDATRFLYSGDNPVQRGVAPGTIDDQRVSVIKGKVVDRDGKALAGAQVTVLDHPEFGYTQTRADGAYDLAINGANLILVFEKAGYLPVQRTLDPNWQDYDVQSDVAMVPVDPAVTEIDPASTAPIQVAESSPTQDADGRRQSLLFFTDGTKATMTLPDGSKKPVEKLEVRVTEYTQGDDGDSAMPGTLPSTTGYTYAAEYSIDEALKAKATRVDFDRPVLNYLENFTGAPVGGVVPTGYYDRADGQWKAGPNGKVLKVVSKTGGIAGIDVTGDGAADTGEALTKLGITDDERRAVAARYDVGEELWRVPLDHFTPWDHNWPYGPPPGAKPPKLKEFEWQDPNDPCKAKGSVIGCETQTLGEAIPLVGTDQTLHYTSDRTPGWKVDDKLQIPVTPPVIPDRLKGVQLEVTIGGKKTEYRWCDPNYPTTGTQTCGTLPTIKPNLTHTISWDGVDAYNREVQGRMKATIRVLYIYEFNYYDAPEDFEASFGQFPSDTEVFDGRGACGNRAGNMESHFFCGVPVGQTITRYVGSWDSREATGLGGFSLSGHHSFDPGNGVVHKGDGQTMSAGAMSKSLSTIAGAYSGPRLGHPDSEGKDAKDITLDYLGGFDRAPDGSLFVLVNFNEKGIFRVAPDGKVSRYAGARLNRENNPYEGLQAPISPDGTPAKEAKLGYEPANLAVGPDGSVYWSSYSASSNNYSISKITPEGRVQRVAGSDAPSAEWADDKPATQTRLGGIRGILPAPDGTVYFTERGTGYNGWHARVRKVTPAGLTATVAGGGSDKTEDEDLGEGEPARDASFAIPYGMTLGDDGSLYFALPNENVVEKVTPQGRLQRVAGNHTSTYEVPQYGRIATEANIGAPVDVAMGRDGSLYIRHNQSGTPSGSLISRVRGDGRLEHVAGHLRGTCGYSLSPEGEQATRSCIEASDGGLHVDADGRVIYADGRHQIRRIDPPLPGFDREGYAVPATDGSEVWEFDRDGRHLKTRDGLTGAVTQSFAYGDHGLSKLTDRDGNVTTIERSATGAPQAIVGPGGQRTTLTLGAGGWLSEVKNPAGEATKMTYHAGGLLATFKKPAGGTTELTYDANGRLTKDISADGVTTTLERTQSETATSVKVTAGNRTTTYNMETLDTGERQRRIVRPGGLTTISKTLLDGSTERTDPDGTKTTQVNGADPRWGAGVIVPQERTVTTPSGKKKTSTWTRTVSLADPKNPMSVVWLSVKGPEGTWDYSQGDEDDPDDQTMTLRSKGSKISTTTLDRRGRAIKVKPDSAVEPITIDYDERGGVKTVTQGDTKQTFAYDEKLRLQSRTDATGNALVYGYDAADRIATVTVPDDVAGDSVFRYTYDADGGTKSVTTPEGKVHAFTRTETGREQTYTPAGQSTKYAQDYFGNRELKSRTVPTGATTAYDYTDGGQLKGEDDGAAKKTYSYVDGADQFDVITRALSGGGGTQSIDYGYDGALPTSMAFTGAAEGTYAYAWSDKLLPTQEKLTVDGTEYADAMEFDSDELPTRRGPFTFTRGGPGGAIDGIAGGPLAIDMDYDGLARIKQRTVKVAGGDVYGQQFTYDQASRISSTTDSPKGAAVKTRNYEYDGRGQLRRVKEGGSVVEEYVYDADGNRTSAKVGAAPAKTATFDAGGQLKTLGGVAYTFDADGFMTKRGSDEFTWSRDGQLLTAKVGGVVATYTYDALGRRTARTAGGDTQTYLYGDPAQPFRVTAWKDPGGTWTRASYDEHDQLFALRRGAATYAVGADQVGSPRVVADKDGVVVKRIAYDAFGQPTVEAGDGFSLPIGFAGGLQDPLTGLVRFGLRDYEPASGRFVFRDPSLFSGSPDNLFAYAGSNPIQNRDPSGLVCASFGAFGGAGGGIQFCRDNAVEKANWSMCAELGVGVGGGVEIDAMAGAQDTGGAIVAELTGKAGIIGGTIGGEMSLDCFNVKGGAKVQAGPVKASVDTSGTPDFGYTQWENVTKVGGKIEGKLAWKQCAKW
ncbi:MAG: hypothetical protein JHD16_06740 [Solirubrobacteraceae bacterium]|nr:hypothetical protein [Solirubrobacteraceae bacterium]